MKYKILLINVIIFSSCLHQNAHLKKIKTLEFCNTFKTKFRKSDFDSFLFKAIENNSKQQHGVHYLDQNGKEVTADSVGNLLKLLRKLDDFSIKNSTLHLSKNQLIYKKKSANDSISKMTQTTIHATNNLTIESFEFFYQNQSKRIFIKQVLNEPIIKLRVNQVSIRSVNEMVPIGIENFF